MFMFKNAVKKKLFEKIRKKQNHAQVSHSFKENMKHIKFLKLLKKRKLLKENFKT